MSGLALAAGVNVILSPYGYVEFAQASTLSTSGRCGAFVAGADEFVRAEGGGVVVLKSLPDALADGDRGALGGPWARVRTVTDGPSACRPGRGRASWSRSRRCRGRRWRLYGGSGCAFVSWSLEPVTQYQQRLHQA
ncbi:MAG: hypothetical protein HOV84_10955, partial [Streptomyces sp.]|nr:hypothetical protein [Streptomyces sp.]